MVSRRIRPAPSSSTEPVLVDLPSSAFSSPDFLPAIELIELTLMAASLQPDLSTSVSVMPAP